MPNRAASASFRTVRMGAERQLFVVNNPKEKA